jgi:hypothetical protein
VTALRAVAAPEPNLRELFSLFPIGRVPSAEEMSRTWPIPGLIHSGLTCVTGQPYAGKTTLCVALARLLLDGAKVGPWQASQRFERVLICAETADSAARADRALCEYGDRAWVGVTQLWAAVDGSRFGNYLRDAGVGVVIIDSAYRAAGDVNDSNGSGAFVECVSQIGLPVVVVHHEKRGAGGTGPAGWQGWPAAYRHTLEVKPLADDGLSVRVHSSNDWPTRERWTVALDRETGQLIDVSVAAARAPRVAKLSDAARIAALANLMDRPPGGLTAGQLASALMGPSRNISPEKAEAVRLAAWPHRPTPPTWETVRNLISKNLEGFTAACKNRGTPLEQEQSA